MKLLEKYLNRLRPLFDKDKKLSMFHPIFDAFESIILATPGKTEHPPFGRDSIDIKKYMSLVIFALFPSLIAGLYFFGYRIFLMLLVSYTFGGIIEVTFAIIRKHEINEGFLVTGFIFPLILPINTPLWLVAVGISFGVVVGKEVFGGVGRNLFNPALVGRIFLALAYPTIMASSWRTPSQNPWGYLLNPALQPVVDSVSSATPLIAAKSGELYPLWDLFIGRITGSTGETSGLAIMIGGLFLIFVGIASWRITLSTLLSFCGLNLILRISYPLSVNPGLYNLFSGGLLFGAFFMATDPVTGPITMRGKWAYGMIIGILALVIRSFSGYVEGVMVEILLGNV